jgi:hypothetical protein
MFGVWLCHVFWRELSLSVIDSVIGLSQGCFSPLITASTPLGSFCGTKVSDH